jgi:hypothetical protein
MAMGIFPVGPVPLPIFPPLTAYHLTAKQQLLLASITAGVGVVDMATDFAVAKFPIPYTSFKGFAVSLFEPTLDSMADVQRTRQLLAYTTLVGDRPSDKPVRVMFAGYYILRQLADAALTQPGKVSETSLFYWNDLTGYAASQSPEAIPECEWKDVCGDTGEVRMLDTPFEVADHVNNGMRGVDTFLAATGAHGMLLVDGKPSGGNLAAGVAVPLVSFVLRHDDGQPSDLLGQEGGYLLRDLAFQGGGLLLAYATQDDPKTQFRMTQVMPSLLMAIETPRAFEVLSKTEDAGVYDDQFFLGGILFYGYQNMAAGIATANAIFDKDKSGAARAVPGIVAAAGLAATTIYMNELDVTARDESSRTGLFAIPSGMDPKLVGVVSFAGGVGMASLGNLVPIIFPKLFSGPSTHAANGPAGGETWNGQVTDVKFDLAPAMLPAATGGSTPGLQAGVSFRF